MILQKEEPTCYFQLLNEFLMPHLLGKVQDHIFLPNIGRTIAADIPIMSCNQEAQFNIIRYTTQNHARTVPK